MSAGNTGHAVGSYKGAARITGALFIIATAASLLSAAFLTSVGDADYLTKVAGSGGQVAGGVLLRFIAAFASAAIALSIYPVLRRYRQGRAGRLCRIWSARKRRDRHIRGSDLGSADRVASRAGGRHGRRLRDLG